MVQRYNAESCRQSFAFPMRNLPYKTEIGSYEMNAHISDVCSDGGHQSTVRAFRCQMCLGVSGEVDAAV